MRIDLDPESPLNRTPAGLGPFRTLNRPVRYRIKTRLLVLAAYYREGEQRALDGGLPSAAACYHYLGEEAEQLSATIGAGIRPF